MDLRQWITAQWDRALAVVLVLLGALALLLGWLGIDDALYPGQQIPYVLSGGVGGLFLVGVGAVLWLSADLRDEWRKLDEIDQKLDRLLQQQAAPPAAAAAEAGEREAEERPPARRSRAPRRTPAAGAAPTTARRSRSSR